MSCPPLYDPPNGWKYGFPKPYKPLEGETTEETLARDGYPASEFDKDGKAHWVRFLDCREEWPESVGK